MINKSDALFSEKQRIEELLTGLDASAFLDRLSLEARLGEVKREIENLKLETVHPRAELTFRGAPVDGSRGILATFSSEATKLFSDAFSLAVAGVKENLRYMGPVPQRADHELKIVGTAVGSFGFTFELPEFNPDLLFDGETLEQRAVNLIISLMESASNGDDELIADQLDQIHPRAARKVAAFMAYAAAKSAVFSVNSENRSLRFNSVEELQESSERLTSNHIREYKVSLTGSFLGVLPESRNFEFRIQDNGDVIRGKLSPEFENPEKLNDLFGKLFAAQFEVVQVGQGRPRYVLKAFGDLKPMVTF